MGLTIHDTESGRIVAESRGGADAPASVVEDATQGVFLRYQPDVSLVAYQFYYLDEETVEARQYVAVWEREPLPTLEEMYFAVANTLDEDLIAVPSDVPGDRGGVVQSFFLGMQSARAEVPAGELTGDRPADVTAPSGQLGGVVKTLVDEESVSFALSWDGRTPAVADLDLVVQPTDNGQQLDVESVDPGAVKGSAGGAADDPSTGGVDGDRQSESGPAGDEPPADGDADQHGGPDGTGEAESASDLVDGDLEGSFPGTAESTDESVPDEVAEATRTDDTPEWMVDDGGDDAEPGGADETPAGPTDHGDHDGSGGDVDAGADDDGRAPGGGTVGGAAASAGAGGELLRVYDGPTGRLMHDSTGELDEGVEYPEMKAAYDESRFLVYEPAAGRVQLYFNGNLESANEQFVAVYENPGTEDLLASLRRRMETAESEHGWSLRRDRGNKQVPFNRLTDVEPESPPLTEDELSTVLREALPVDFGVPTPLEGLKLMAYLRSFADRELSFAISGNGRTEALADVDVVLSSKTLFDEVRLLGDAGNQVTFHRLRNSIGAAKSTVGDLTRRVEGPDLPAVERQQVTASVLTEDLFEDRDLAFAPTVRLTEIDHIAVGWLSLAAVLLVGVVGVAASGLYARPVTIATRTFGTAVPASIRSAAGPLQPLFAAPVWFVALVAAAILCEAAVALLPVREMVTLPTPLADLRLVAQRVGYEEPESVGLDLSGVRADLRDDFEQVDAYLREVDDESLVEHYPVDSYAHDDPEAVVLEEEFGDVVDLGLVDAAQHRTGRKRWLARGLATGALVGVSVLVGLGALAWLVLTFWGPVVVFLVGAAAAVVAGVVLYGVALLLAPVVDALTGRLSADRGIPSADYGSDTDDSDGSVHRGPDASGPDEGRTAGQSAGEVGRTAREARGSSAHGSGSDDGSEGGDSKYVPGGSGGRSSGHARGSSGGRGLLVLLPVVSWALTLLVGAAWGAGTIGNKVLSLPSILLVVVLALASLLATLVYWMAGGDDDAGTERL